MDVVRSVIVWLVGICFVVITFPVNLLIWILFLPFDKNNSVIHLLLMHESFILCFLIPIWRIEIEGREKAIKGETYVIISNHQSLLDILLINCLRYRFKWVSKIENFKVPVIGWYLRIADYITVDRTDDDSKAKMLEKSYQCLGKGVSVMLFPEGTRSKDLNIGFYKRGAFQLAIQAEVPILPVLIDGSGGILPKHGLIFGGSQKIRIKVLDPVNPSQFETDIPEELALHFNTVMTRALSKLRDESGIK